MASIAGDILDGDTVTKGDLVYERIKRLGGRVMSIAWVSTAGGEVECEISALTGTLMRVVTDPDGGALAPDVDYDIVLNGPDGFDILNGGGANRHTSNSEAFTPFSGDATFGTPMAFDGLLTLLITAAGASNAGTIRLYIKPAF